MPNLIPFNSHHCPGLRRQQARQVASSLRALEAQSILTNAQIAATAEAHARRTDAIAYVARRGMQNIALLSRMEASMATMVPLASGRLAAIGDIAALAISEVVSDTACRIR